MFILGVAGGIGSGKSFVTELLEKKHGAIGIYADRIAHDLLQNGEVVEKLVERFGPSILDEEGKIVRSRLGALVFGDDEIHSANRKFLESALHPPVRVEIRRRIKEARGDGASLVVLDVPLLFESGWDRECDGVAFVDASDAVRFARTAARGWSETAHRRREATQLPLEEKKKRSQWVVSNEGNRESTERQVADLLRNATGR